jgi:NADH-quinone oxidoreductase subunit L
MDHWVSWCLVALPTLPALAAIIAPLAGTGRPARPARISVAMLAATLAIALALLVAVLRAPQGDVALVQLGPAALLLDHLAVAMAVLVAAISLVVHVYSVRYMADEPGYARFFALLDLMTAVILLMVTAADLLTLLVAWFLIGVLLFFLLGFDTSRKASGRYAFWTFLTCRVGDLPLVGAALLLWHGYGTAQLPELFARISADPGVQLGGMAVVPLAALLLALAAFARSAQFLLHTWLPYTMDGPTPVSALMHAGIVNAGDFYSTASLRCLSTRPTCCTWPSSSGW